MRYKLTDDLSYAVKEKLDAYLSKQSVLQMASLTLPNRELLGRIQLAVQQGRLC